MIQYMPIDHNSRITRRYILMESPDPIDTDSDGALLAALVTITWVDGNVCTVEVSGPSQLRWNLSIYDGHALTKTFLPHDTMPKWLSEMVEAEAAKVFRAGNRRSRGARPGHSFL